MATTIKKASINQSFNGEINITIKHAISNGYELITPIVEDDVQWETERQGSPSKLTFKVYKDKNGNLNFQEGDSVILKYRNGNSDWVILFNGYIFTKKRNKDGWIDVIAYDQLRYFKNKATYTYTNKTASDLLKMLANDYKLKIGSVSNTNYVIGSRVEDDQSLFDIIQNALDLTLISSGTMYILYTDNGKLCLKDANDMKTDIVINELTAVDFDYTSSIDEETYNEIELYYDNDKTNKREYYNAIDPTTVSTWGRLRYTESVQDTANIKDRVKTMLKLYNKKTRTLKISDAFGDYHCRAGASVIVQLDLGDITVSNYMLIEKAIHTFKKDEYRMDLTLDGFTSENIGGNAIYSEANVTNSSGTSSSTNTTVTTPTNYTVTVNILGGTNYAGNIDISYYDASKTPIMLEDKTASFKVSAYKDTPVTVMANLQKGHHVEFVGENKDWTFTPDSLGYYVRCVAKVNKNLTLNLRWLE